MLATHAARHQHIGIERPAKDVTPNLSEYLAENYGQQRGNSDEEVK